MGPNGQDFNMSAPKDHQYVTNKLIWNLLIQLEVELLTSEDTKLWYRSQSEAES